MIKREAVVSVIKMEIPVFEPFDTLSDVMDALLTCGGRKAFREWLYKKGLKASSRVKDLVSCPNLLDCEIQAIRRGHYRCYRNLRSYDLTEELWELFEDTHGLSRHSFLEDGDDYA